MEQIPGCVIMTVVDASVKFIKISADQTVAIVVYTAFTFVFSKSTGTVTTFISSSTVMIAISTFVIITTIETITMESSKTSAFI